MSEIKDSYNDVFKHKKRILVVAAHPDDNEVICGGLVARLTTDGKKVRLVVTTNGEKGVGASKTDPTAFGEGRKQEQQKAAAVLGIPVGENFNLDVPDGEFENSLNNIEKIAWHIREFKPDIVITHNPDEVINTFSSKDGVRWVNHRDHRDTALVTTDAIYPYSRDRAFFPDQLQKLEPHTVTEVLYADSYEHPCRVYFDVTDYVDKKAEALNCCPSVIESEHVQEYVDETKIGDRYYEQLRYYSRLY
ncbi:PIG-L family deacetylase [Candidatus Saccharibacteria bacterium]|nr:PIG-L family deacetylase [Candidatus Saccharibacteria bacterium]